MPKPEAQRLTRETELHNPVDAATVTTSLKAEILKPSQNGTPVSIPKPKEHLQKVVEPVNEYRPETKSQPTKAIQAEELPRQVAPPDQDNEPPLPTASYTSIMRHILPPQSKGHRPQFFWDKLGVTLSKLDPDAVHHDSSRKLQPGASVSPLFQTPSAGDMTFDSDDVRMSLILVKRLYQELNSQLLQFLMMKELLIYPLCSVVQYI